VFPETSGPRRIARTRFLNFRLGSNPPTMLTCSGILLCSGPILGAMKPLICAMIATALMSCASAQTPAPALLRILALDPPHYPPIAIAARVIGGVKLKVKIGDDGKVQTVEVASGPQMLKKAAVDSAKESTFQPLPANQKGQVYELTYVFELQFLNCGEALDTSYPRVKSDSNIITISAQSMPICDPAAEIPVRSARCLWLWRCGRT
jgi:TonB family protein